jgi:hypothetical protein
VDVVAAALGPGDVVCGEIERLPNPAVEVFTTAGARVIASTAPRVVAIGRLGLRRMARGEIDNADALVPLYLRAPAIGPQ